MYPFHCAEGLSIETTFYFVIVIFIKIQIMKDDLSASFLILGTSVYSENSTFLQAAYLCFTIQYFTYFA